MVYFNSSLASIMTWNTNSSGGFRKDESIIPVNRIYQVAHIQLPVGNHMYTQHGFRLEWWFAKGQNRYIPF